MLLKSSDFIAHDLSTDNVFEGCEDALSTSYDLELVLRKWYPVDRSRELRCFVRQNVLVGISQRDNNYYEFLNEPATYNSIAAAVLDFWQKHIRGSENWESTPDCTLFRTFHLFQHCSPSTPSDTFDFLLTRDLSRGHIIDFNPYAPRTDPLLFTYEELAELLEARIPAETSSTSTLPNGAQDHAAPSLLPEFRVIDSRSHPAATSNAPAHQHNMVPFEALSLSSGRDIEEFADTLKNEIQESMTM